MERNSKQDLERPDDAWVQSRLEVIAETASGGTPDRKRADFYGGGIPWVKSGELNDRYIFGTEESLSPEGLKQSSAKLFPSGTLLIAMYGATVGKTAILKLEAATNQAVCAIFPDSEKADAEFLRYFLIGEREELLKQRYGGAQPNISQNVIRSFPVRRPPLAEQRNIASVLRLAQKAVEHQEGLLRLAAELKRTLLHHLFTHGRRGETQKQTDIGPVPESWRLTNIGDVAKIQSGGTPSREVPENWQSGTIPWVKTGEIDYCVICETEELITPTGLADSSARVFPIGTLLMAMYGQGITRGRVAILGIAAATNQACAAIMPHDESKVSSLYLYYFLEYHYETLRKLGHGANQKNMNAALIRGFPVAFPSSSEQAEIVSALSSLDAKQQIHRRRHAAFSDLFRTLLRQLMTAQIRVNEIDV